MKKRLNQWKPGTSLAGIPREGKPLLRIPGSVQGWQDFEAIFTGAIIGGAGFAAANPSCLYPSAPQRPEIGLAFGAGLSGFFWLFTGHNYMALAGVGTALAGYLVCKLTE